MSRQSALGLVLAQVFVALTMSAPCAHAQTEGDIAGLWYTEGQQSRIEIRQDAATKKFDGAIVWLKEPLVAEGEDAGKPKRDIHNPDPEHQQDPIVGLKLLKGFTHDSESKTWSGGTIYDPESGKTYKCTIKLGENGELSVRGYIGIPSFGRTTTWTRVPKEEIEKEKPADSDSAAASDTVARS